MKPSKADKEAAARILKRPTQSDHVQFKKHVVELIAEGARLGKVVRVDVEPETQWSKEAKEAIAKEAQLLREKKEVRVGSMIMVHIADGWDVKQT